MWWLISAALAAPPTSIPETLSVGDSADRLQLSSDGRLLVGVSGGSVFGLDADSWSTPTTNAVCSANGATVTTTDDPEVYEVFAACADGTVAALAWSADGFADSERETANWDLQTSEALGVWFADLAGTDTLFVLANDTSSGSDDLFLHTIDLSTDVVDSASTYPLDLLRTEYTDAVLQVGGGTTRLFVAHSGDFLFTYNLTNGTTVTPNNSSASVGDVANFYTATGDSVLAASGQQIYRYVPTGTTGTGGAGWSIWYTGEATHDYASVGHSANLDDGWAVMARDGAVDVVETTGTVSTAGSLATIDTSLGLVDIVTNDAGYAFAASDDGSIAILTANPWVGGVSVSPDTGVSGTVATVAFTPDVDGSYKVYLGGDRTGTGGDELAQGDGVAGTQTTVEVTVGDDWDEGTHALYIVYSANALTGHGRANFTKDNVPGSVDLSVGFGNEAIVLSFDGVDDEDLASYDVYMSLEPFSAADYADCLSTPAACGPLYTPTDEEIDNDVTGYDTITEVEPSGAVEHRISGLTNDVTYYVAVRAVDSSGQRGPMSDVIAETPESTIPPSLGAGEPGGPLCATGPGPGGLALLLAPIIALGRRRRSVAAAALLAVGAPAAAVELPKDLGNTRGNVEVRYGQLNYERDANGDAVSAVDQAYGSSGQLGGFQIEAGPAFMQVVELDLGLGRHSKLGYQVGVDSDRISADDARLTWYDLSIAATGRLQFLDEQPIVPFARFGFNRLIWQESWESGRAADPDKPLNPGTRDRTSGAFNGRHLGYGVNILLDWFQPRRASTLESQTSINDTFLVIEWRQQRIENRVGGAEPADGDPGYNFTGRVWSAGLKMDF